MTCFTDPVLTDAPRPDNNPSNSRLERIRERLASGYYDRPEILDEAIDRLADVVREPDA